jgi:hypothetical protein
MSEAKRTAARNILNLLRDRGARGASSSELLRVGGARYGGRIFDLRKRGYTIATWRTTRQDAHGNDRAVYYYALDAAVGVPVAAFDWEHGIAK